LQLKQLAQINCFALGRLCSADVVICPMPLMTSKILLKTDQVAPPCFDNAYKNETFVGLGKCEFRTMHVSEEIAISALLKEHVTDHTRFCWFDRFIVGGKLITTSAYAEKFKRDDSILLMHSRELGKVVSCAVIKNCLYVADCSCVKETVLVIHCFTVVSGSPAIHYCFVGINLCAFKYTIVNNSYIVKTFMPDSIACKCVLATGCGGTKYIIKLPTIEFE
jgi:hypothetical protein